MYVQCVSDFALSFLLLSDKESHFAIKSLCKFYEGNFVKIVCTFNGIWTLGLKRHMDTQGEVRLKM